MFISLCICQFQFCVCNQRYSKSILPIGWNSLSHSPLHVLILPHLLSFLSPLLSITYYPQIPLFPLRNALHLPTFFVLLQYALRPVILRPSAVHPTSCHSSSFCSTPYVLSFYLKQYLLLLFIHRYTKTFFPRIIHYLLSFNQPYYPLHIILRSRCFLFRNVLSVPHSW